MDDDAYEWTVGYNKSEEYRLYPAWAHDVSIEIIHDDDTPFESPRARYADTSASGDSWIESDTTIALDNAE
jgi:hypothetical protein